MAVVTFTGKSRKIAQIATVVVGGSPNGTTFSIKIEHPSGSEGTLVTIASVVGGGGDTTDTIAASLQAAWAASNYWMALRAASSVSSSTITFTANYPGEPFLLTVAVSGGTGTLTKTVTTANRGPSDLADVGNYEGGTYPVNSDYLNITGESPILYGLDLSAVSLSGCTVANRDFGIIGTPGIYLKLTTSTFVFDSGGVAWIDLQASTCSPIIKRTAFASPFGLYLKGSAISNNTETTPMRIEGGRTALAWKDGETATCHYAQINGGGHLAYGLGVTWTRWKQSGGTGEIRATDGGTLIDVSNGGYLREESAGAITSLVSAGRGTLIDSNGSGTITTNTNLRGGVTDFTKCRSSRTVTNIDDSNAEDGGAMLDSSIISVTTYTPGKSYGGHGRGGGGGTGA